MRFKGIMLLLGCCVALVWFQSWCNWPRRWLGVQIDLVPTLVMYCALYCSWRELFLVSIVGGVFFDSLSCNPMGCTSASLLLIGYWLYCYRKIFLYNRIPVQILLGCGVSVLVPFLTMIQLTGVIVAPVLEWKSVFWVLFILGATGGVVAPPAILWLNRILNSEWVTGHRRYFSSSVRRESGRR